MFIFLLMSKNVYFFTQLLQVRILILHFSCMNHFSDYDFANYSTYIFNVIRLYFECQLVVF